MQERGAGTEDAVLRDGAGGVAGHEQDAGLWMRVSDALGELAAVASGHDDVGEEQIDDGVGLVGDLAAVFPLVYIVLALLMLAMMILVVIVGTALDMTPTILILTPILMPIIKQAGIKVN